MAPLVRGFLVLSGIVAPVLGQESPLVVRPGPPALEDFETDEDSDGVPDGWYNLRDAKLVPGGVVGPRCLRFENDRPGRPARISRAFGVDGRKTEALIIGLWVRVESVNSGERLGEDPGMIIDFLGEELKGQGRAVLGSWTRSMGNRWVRVARRIPVPLGTRDVILSVGLLGATGTLEIDGMTIEEVAVGGSPTTNLVLNGDFELGDPDPFHWSVEGGARRAFPGRNSASCLELVRSGAKAQNGLSLPVARYGELEIRLAVRANGLRGGGGAVGEVYFLDEDGRVLPGLAAGARAFRWGGNFDWRPDQAIVRVPQDAVRAVLQLEKTDSIGSIQFDNVEVYASPDPDFARWTPYHVQTDTDTWKPYLPKELIEKGSALDASGLVEAPAGTHGFVTAKGGHLVFEKGGRARFFGVVLLPPMAFPTPDRAELLADRLARRGVNLVRFDDLDAPFGPGRSLFDDTVDNTTTIDPTMLARFEHLVAALKARGIYVSLELIAARRFRSEDQVPGAAGLPPGGGPAVAFDPKVRELILETTKALLGHVNPETGLPLRDDPVLAWITLSGEQSLFDLINEPGALPADSAAVLRKLSQKSRLGSGRRFWQATEEDQWREMARELREWGVKVPIAGVSHWRREPEFNASQAIKELDLIDDRLYWAPPRYAIGERRSMLWRSAGGLVGEASKKRRNDQPFVVSQWAAHTDGAWALPYEGADLLYLAEAASVEDWDALVRRGVFLYPDPWGSAATGTGGEGDVFPLVEVLNANPAVFSLLPHAASVFLRGTKDNAQARRTVRRKTVWDPRLGRLVMDTPHTAAIVGWAGDRTTSFETLSLETSNRFAVVAVSSLESEPLTSAKRLLVTAIARVEPTGLTYVDEFRKEVANPGRPPLLLEPVRARILWKTSKRGARAFALDNAGHRLNPVPLVETNDGVRLTLDGESSTIHWELVGE